MTLRISSGSNAVPWPTEPEDLPESTPSDVEADPTAATTAATTEVAPEEVESPPPDEPKPPSLPLDEGPSATDLHLQQQSLGWATAGDESVGAKMLRWLRGDSAPAPVSPGNPTGVAEPKAPTTPLYATTAAALQAGAPNAALQRLNGLSMTAMLGELAQLSPGQRAALHPALHVAPQQYSNRGLPPVTLGAAEGVDGERIGYALCVVETHLLPVYNPGDVQTTGQAKEAADFLAEQVYLPVAKGANSQATPHVSRLLLEMQTQGVTDPDHIAYILATAHHEAYMGREMDEIGVKPGQYNAAKHPHLGNTHAGDSLVYAGKGYVQLTGKANYDKMGKVFQEDLVNHPDRATEPELAKKIIVHGMTHGSFTGKNLANYDQKNGSFDFVNARAIVNGDKDDPVNRNDSTSEKTGLHVANVAKLYRRRMHGV